VFHVCVIAVKIVEKGKGISAWFQFLTILWCVSSCVWWSFSSSLFISFVHLLKLWYGWPNLGAYFFWSTLCLSTYESAISSFIFLLLGSIWSNSVRILLCGVFFFVLFRPVVS